MFDRGNKLAGAVLWLPPVLGHKAVAPYKGDNFIDRISTAANARKATLEKFRARPGPNDPAVVARQAARQAVSDAREARVAARCADAVRQATEEAARVAEQAAREAEEARRAAEQVACGVVLEAERKAARDARYAARKARQRR